MTLYLHVILYFAPGLAFTGLAAALGRATRVALARARGTEPPWARRYARFAVGMIAVTGLALLMLAGALAVIALRAQH